MSRPRFGASASDLRLVRTVGLFLSLLCVAILAWPPPPGAMVVPLGPPLHPAASQLPPAFGPSTARASGGFATNPPSLPPVAGPVPASSRAPVWINVTRTSGQAPPGEWGASLAYDPTQGEFVYFGGCDSHRCPDNQTWAYAHGSWHNLTAHLVRAPPVRSLASMAYDANVRAILLFGGFDGIARVYNDTWLFLGGVWINASYMGPAPPARLGASLAFDPSPTENGSVLFGGDGLSTIDADTWVWQVGSGWSRVAGAAIGPSSRYVASMAYDPVGGYLLLFGGYGPCSTGDCVFSDTWQLFSGTWWTTTPPISPSARDFAAMGYDEGTRSLILFGGYNLTPSTAQNDTWSYEGGNWTPVTTAASPSARYGASFPTDSSGSSPLLFSGVNPGGAVQRNDTWVFEPRPSLQLSSSSPPWESAASVAIVLTLTGGTSPYNATVSFGDGSIGVVAASGPTLSVQHTYSRAGNFTVHANASDAFGVLSSSSLPVRVVAGPSVTAFALAPGADAGAVAKFSSRTLSGGIAPDSYAWRFGDGTNGSGPTISHAYASPGTYPVQVTLRDGAGASSTSALTFLVASLPGLTFLAVPATPRANERVVLGADVTGGTPPFEYSWILGDGSASSSPTPDHVYAAGGSYSVQLWVNDSGGGSTHETVPFVVDAASPSPSIQRAAATPWWFWSGVAAVIAAGIAGAWLLGRRRAPTVP